LTGVLVYILASINSTRYLLQKTFATQKWLLCCRHRIILYRRENKALPGFQKPDDEEENKLK
jgi:hypothetical protein